MARPKFVSATCLGEYIAGFVLAKEGARRHFKAATILAVASRGTIEIRIIPAKVDCITSLERITRGLATGLVQSSHRVRCLIHRAARGSQSVELVGYFVIMLGTGLHRRLCSIRENASIRGTGIQHSLHFGSALVRAGDAREETVPVHGHVLSVKLGDAARLRVHVARLVLAEERARGRLEVPAVLTVTRRGAVEVGVLPAEVDGIASLEGVAGRLTAGLVQISDRIGRLIHGGAARGEAVGLVRNFVVPVDAHSRLALVGIIGTVDGRVRRIHGRRRVGRGRRHGLGLGTFHRGEQTVRIPHDLIRPLVLRPARFGVHVASLPGGQVAGGRVEISARAQVARGPALASGIPPAKLDGVAIAICVLVSIVVVAGCLTRREIEVEDGFGVGSSGEGTGGRLAVKLVGNLVVASGANLMRSRGEGVRQMCMEMNDKC